MKLKREEKFMRLALKQAKLGLKNGEVPIGAVIVLGDKVIARGRNYKEKYKNATLHAEIVAINRACKKLGDWRLLDCEMFVTLEPCPMCAGAIVNSRLKKVYFGAYDECAGGVETLYQITSDKRLSHRLESKGGVLERECKEIIVEFFKSLRKNNKKFID